MGKTFPRSGALAVGGSGNEWSLPDVEFRNHLGVDPWADRNAVFNVGPLVTAHADYTADWEYEPMALRDTSGNELERGQPVNRSRRAVAEGRLVVDVPQNGKWWEKEPSAQVSLMPPLASPDAPGSRTVRQAVHRPQWEYMTYDLPAADDAATATARLNDFGYQGWELIALPLRPKMVEGEPFVTAWFKRLRIPGDEGSE